MKNLIIRGGWLIVLLALSGCLQPNQAPPTLVATAVEPSVTPTPTITPTLTPTLSPTPTLTLTPTVTPFVPDYSNLQSDLEAYAAAVKEADGIDLGIAFIDLLTGDQVAVRGDERFYSLSTFKAPLGAYFLWLVEQGQLEEIESDEYYLFPMLDYSSNTATTCIVERVGGLPGFNDWLAMQGLDRAGNFVIAWDAWACPPTGHIPDPDVRYLRGDVGLGIPSNVRLCPDVDVRCDKAFTPESLAAFYERMYRGEVINEAGLQRWYGWMVNSPEGTFFDDDLRVDVPVTAYTKNGYRAKDGFIDQHFYHEAGIIGTQRGDFVLVVFMQNNPVWPGDEVLSEVAGMVHQAFIENHP